MPVDSPPSQPYQDLAKLPPDQQRARRRNWNRGPISDLYPRIPREAFERVLDLCIDKGFTYDLSRNKFYNARRYTSMIVAHIRHQYSDYDKLLREDGFERYDARAATSNAVWKVLKNWCPYDELEVLKRCFDASIIRPEHRSNAWDPMDIDEDSEVECTTKKTSLEDEGDPMDLD